MIFNNLNGFLWLTMPAMAYCARSTTMKRITMTTITFKYTCVTIFISPETCIFMNIPKIYTGSSGSTTFVIIIITTSRSSLTRPLSLAF